MKRIFLLAVARYFKENEEVYAPLSELEKAYAVICEEFEEQPNSHTQLWNYTQYLAKLGVLKTEVTSAETRGQSDSRFAAKYPC